MNLPANILKNISPCLQSCHNQNKIVNIESTIQPKIDNSEKDYIGIMLDAWKL